ncbi:MAG: protein tyrosine phosphatase family protein [Cocleimonas sp.]|nr:protein tyrosine phosphatase family protein [Cocleimonas sp.]
MNITKAYNFINIDERVSSSGLIITVDLQSFVDEGYKCVINLLPDDNEHARKGEKESFVTLGIDYHYIPVVWEAPTKADYEAFEASMVATQDKKLHIHCAANYRATVFYAIYAHKYFSWSADKINAFTNEVWALSDYPVWRAFVDKMIVDEKTNDL